MKRITKATHTAFITALDSACKRAGIQKAEHPFQEDAPAYSIETEAGNYTFHPECPISEEKRPLLHITVFGRFDNPSEARKLVDCNPFSGKWNFHAGHCDVSQAIDYAHYVVSRILRIKARPLIAA